MIHRWSLSLLQEYFFPGGEYKILLTKSFVAVFIQLYYGLFTVINWLFHVIYFLLQYYRSLIYHLIFINVLLHFLSDPAFPLVFQCECNIHVFKKYWCWLGCPLCCFCTKNITVSFTMKFIIQEIKLAYKLYILRDEGKLTICRIKETHCSQVKKWRVDLEGFSCQMILSFCSAEKWYAQTLKNDRNMIPRSRLSMGDGGSLKWQELPSKRGEDGTDIRIWKWRQKLDHWSSRDWIRAQFSFFRLEIRMKLIVNR